MEKILLAVGNKDLEQAIFSKVKADFKVCGAVTRKGQIINAIKETAPGIIILRESLPGNENLKDIVMNIRMNHPYVRIIFIASHRQPGDTFLSLLVSYSVYDIICGESITLDDILGLIYSKNDYKDIHHLQPKITFDDNDAPVFSMPESIIIERKRVDISSTNTSEEDTATLRRELEEEILSKYRSKVKQEYERELKLQLQKGIDKEKEVVSKLELEYKQKMVARENELREELEKEAEERAKAEVEKVKKLMIEKLEAREAMLKGEMELKIKNAVKNSELKTQKEVKEYEALVRKKFQDEFTTKLKAEKDALEKEKLREIETVKQKELAQKKAELLSELEEESRRNLKLKEIEIEKALEAKKDKELNEAKKRLEDEKLREIEELRSKFQLETKKQIDEYEKAFNDKYQRDISKIEQDADKKSKEHIAKAKSKMENSIKAREAELKKVMEEKIEAVLKENADLKNKFESDEYENSIRSKYQRELEDILKREKDAIELANKERIEKLKQEYVTRKSEELKKQFENEVKQQLKQKEHELELKKEADLNRIKNKLEIEKSNEVTKLRQEFEDINKREIETIKLKSSLEIKKIEEKKNEELKKIQSDKDNAILRIENSTKEEIKNIKDRLEKEKLEELRLLEEKYIAEQKRLKAEQIRLKEVQEQRLRAEQEKFKIEQQRIKSEQERLKFEQEQHLKAEQERLKAEQEEFIKNETQFIMKNNQKIVSFVGGKSGVGTSTVAINVASKLAMQGSNVLYLELNSNTPSIGYWYQIDREFGGLESALDDIVSKNYINIPSSIVKSKDLKVGEYGKFYRNFPDKLDFLLFSRQTTLLKKDIVDFDETHLKELYFYLMQHLGYEYLIIDLKPDEHDPFVNSTLLFSTKVYAVITQDVSSIAYSNYRFDRMEKKNMPISRKTAFVLNRTQEKGSKLLSKEISKWLINKKLFLVPEFGVENINANYDGYPIILSTKNKDINKSIESISSDISSNNSRKNKGGCFSRKR